MVNAERLFSSGVFRLIYCELALEKLTATGILLGCTAPSVDVEQVVGVISASGIGGAFSKIGFVLWTVPLGVVTVIKPEAAPAGTIAVICVLLLEVQG